MTTVAWDILTTVTTMITIFGISAPVRRSKGNVDVPMIGGSWDI
jgi:hypothetical protein